MKNSVNKKALAVLLAAVMVFEGTSSISVVAQEVGSEKIVQEQEGDVLVEEVRSELVENSEFCDESGNKNIIGELNICHMVSSEVPINEEMVIETETINGSGNNVFANEAELPLETEISGEAGNTEEEYQYYHIKVEETGEYIIKFSNITGKGQLSLTNGNQSYQLPNFGVPYSYVIYENSKNLGMGWKFTLNADVDYYLRIKSLEDKKVSYVVKFGLMKNMCEKIELEEEKDIALTGDYQYEAEKSGLYQLNTKNSSAINILIYDISMQQIYSLYDSSQSFYLKKGQKYYLKILTEEPEVESFSLKNIQYVEFEQNIVAAGVCDSSIKWEYQKGEILKVGGSGKIVSNPWKIYASKMKEVIIEDGITEIGNSVFAQCSMENVTLANSIKKIGISAFYVCTNLKSIQLPNSLQEIEQNAFMGCFSLNTVTFKEKSDLKMIGEYAFSGTSWIKNSSNGFAILDDILIAYTGNEKEITIPSNVRCIGKKAFNECKETEKINISDNVKEIWDYAFYDCKSIKEITIPGSVSKVTYCSFQKCTALEDVIVENGVASIDKAAFVDCEKLNEIKIAQSVKKIGDHAIGYLYDGNKRAMKKVNALPTIYCYSGSTAYKYAVSNEIPYTLLEQKSLAGATVTFSQKEYAYNGKSQKPEVTVTLNGTTLKPNVDYTVSYKNNTNIGTAKATITGVGNYKETVTKNFTIAAKKGTTVETDKYKYKFTGSNEVAFAGIKNSEMKKVTIPTTVKLGGKSWKVTSVSNNALKKTQVTSVTVGSNVKTIGNSAFEGCSKLTKVTIGSGVTKLGSNTFKNCKKLGQVTIKSTKLKTVGKNSFKGIKSNAKIKVPSKKLSSYKKVLKNKGQGSKVKVVK